MRIVVVSAHYPPNFVSGGTLQPQRLARGLRSRGHDVSVYAGWIGATRPPLSTFTETDDTGLPIRWIVTTPFTDWADRGNYDNPAVKSDFAEHLAAEQPDVVHFHSLQSLGAGVVSAATEAGTRTVVTMHDFWWCCGRQFLADRELVPCCLVVDTGVCQCHLDRAWLDARNEMLADVLTSVDVVLTPSASAASVLVANGVDADRLAVDENGVDSVQSNVTAVRGDRPYTILYTGGSEELKGIHVLAAAAKLLAAESDLADWRVVAYGADRWASEHPGAFGAAPVHVLAPFAPDDRADVLSSADVLVIPSIARESYSIVAREASAGGVAVVSSDCLGPEEVVDEALVVPTGDAVALATVLRRLITGSIRPAPTPTASRQVSEQVIDLEQRFADLLDGPARPVRAAGATTRALFVVGIDGAPLRYRVHQPAEAIAHFGVESTVCWYTDPDLAARAEAADVVVVYRSPATPDLLRVIDQTRLRGIAVAFDADDLIFDPTLAGIPAVEMLAAEEAARWLEGVRRYRTTMEACDAFIATTSPLARHAADVTGLAVERFDNGVGRVTGRWSDRALRRPRTPGPLRLGYFSGTITHDADWLSIEPAVLQALARHPTAELWLVGHVEPSAALAALGARVRRVPFTPWTELPAILRDVDVNLAPIEPGILFNEAKSHVKWLEAALVATPTIASPTEPFVAAIEPGRNGVLATTVDEWTAALDELLDDDVARARMGHRARRSALLGWSPAQQGVRYADILERIRARGVVTRQSTWDPVVVDEPEHHQPLLPYASLDPMSPRRRRTVRSRVRSLLRR